MASQLIATATRTPASRGLIAASLVTAALWTLRPPSMFRESDGQPRMWNIAAVKERHAYEATPVPWYLFVAASGLAVTLFS